MNEANYQMQIPFYMSVKNHFFLQIFGLLDIESIIIWVLFWHRYYRNVPNNIIFKHIDMPIEIFGLVVNWDICGFRNNFFISLLFISPVICHVCLTSRNHFPLDQTRGSWRSSHSPTWLEDGGFTEALNTLTDRTSLADFAGPWSSHVMQCCRLVTWAFRRRRWVNTLAGRGNLVGKMVGLSWKISLWRRLVYGVWLGVVVFNSTPPENWWCRSLMVAWEMVPVDRGGSS